MSVDSRFESILTYFDLSLNKFGLVVVESLEFITSLLTMLKQLYITDLQI